VTAAASRSNINLPLHEQDQNCVWCGLHQRPPVPFVRATWLKGASNGPRDSAKIGWVSRTIGRQSTLSNTSRLRWLLIVLLSGQFMANIDSAIVNLAVASISTGFGTSEGEVALVVSSYMVAFAVLLIPGARLGAARGHRRVFLWGLSGFIAASLACGLAPGVATLIVARFVQGAAAALMVPQVLSGIQLHFTGRQRVRALGWYAVALSGGAVTGQILGGLLISADLFGATWRPVFLINVPIGVALLVVAHLVLPADDVRERQAMDLRGVVTLSISVLLVIAPLVLGREQGWPTWTWVCFVAAVPAFLGFVLTERRAAARGARPLVTPAVLRPVGVRLGLLAHGTTASTYFALLFVVALYIQQGLGGSPARAGFAMVAWVTAFGLAGPLLVRLPARHLPLAPVAGCLVLAIGYLSVCAHLLTAGGDGPVLFALLGIGGLGLGISANSLIGAMTSAVPAGLAADLSGLISINAQLSGALGVALAGAGYQALGGGEGAFAVITVVFGLLALLAAVAARLATRTPVAGGRSPRPRS
jgi:MFS family permease